MSTPRKSISDLLRTPATLEEEAPAVDVEKIRESRVAVTIMSEIFMGTVSSAFDSTSDRRWMEQRLGVRPALLSVDGEPQAGIALPTDRFRVTSVGERRTEGKLVPETVFLREPASTGGEFRFAAAFTPEDYNPELGTPLNARGLNLGRLSLVDLKAMETDLAALAWEINPATRDSGDRKNPSTQPTLTTLHIEGGLFYTTLPDGHRYFLPPFAKDALKFSYASAEKRAFADKERMKPQDKRASWDPKLGILKDGIKVATLASKSHPKAHGWTKRVEPVSNFDPTVIYDPSAPAKKP